MFFNFYLHNFDYATKKIYFHLDKNNYKTGLIYKCEIFYKCNVIGEIYCMILL